MVPSRWDGVCETLVLNVQDVNADSVRSETSIALAAHASSPIRDFHDLTLTINHQDSWFVPRWLEAS